MAEITATMVKELRERTGVGMMECRKALVEKDGNVDEAIKYLRERGISKAEGKALREYIVSDIKPMDLQAIRRTARITDFN